MMSNGDKDESGNSSFAEFLKDCGPYSRDEPPEQRIVEMVGRVFANDDDASFLLVLLPDAQGTTRLIEAKVEDVLRHEIAFEDSAGRKTAKVRLPEDATVKLLLRASELLSSPTAPPVAKQDPKPDPIKQQDPIGPKPDPKPDPIGPKPDPKQDPKFDPVGPKPDPKPDPKFDPKPDPKQDPIGPGFGGTPGAAQEAMTPFVLATPWGLTKQGN